MIFLNFLSEFHYTAAYFNFLFFFLQRLGCDNGTYGEGCNNTCGNCHVNDVCSHINGTCLAGCGAGFVGELCITR